MCCEMFGLRSVRILLLVCAWQLLRVLEIALALWPAVR